MNDVFPPLGELVWSEIVWLADLLGHGVCIAGILVLPLAGAFATLHRTLGNPWLQLVLGWTGFCVASSLLAAIGVWLFTATFPGIIDDRLTLPLQLVPWLLMGLALVGGPWLLWVTTTKPKTKRTWVALVATYASALVTTIWIVISFP